MECDFWAFSPVHDFYTGICTLQCRNKDRKNREDLSGGLRKVTKGALWLIYVRPWCLDRTLGEDKSTLLGLNLPMYRWLRIKYDDELTSIGLNFRKWSRRNQNSINRRRHQLLCSTQGSTKGTVLFRIT